MIDDPLQIGLNALSNASQTTIDRSDLIAILKTGDGPGHLVRALFEDCSFESLDRMAIMAALSRPGLRAAYGVASLRHGARNADFEVPGTGFVP